MEAIKPTPDTKSKPKDFDKTCQSAIANEKVLLWTRLSCIENALKNVLKSFCKECSIETFFNESDNKNSFKLQFSKEKKCCNRIFDFYPQKVKQNLKSGKLDVKDKKKRKRKYDYIMSNAKDKYILSLVFVIVFAEFMDYVEEIQLFDHLARNGIDSDNSNNNESSHKGSSNNSNNSGNTTGISASKIKKYKVLLERLVLKCLVHEKAKIQARASPKFIFPQKTTDIVQSSIARRLIDKVVRLDNEQQNMYDQKYNQLPDKEKKETKKSDIILEGLIEQRFDSITSTHTKALFWETAGWHLELFGDKDKELLKIFLDVTRDLPKWKQWNKNGSRMIGSKNDSSDEDEDEDDFHNMPSLNGRVDNKNKTKNGNRMSETRDGGMMKAEKYGSDEDEVVSNMGVMEEERKQLDLRSGNGKKRKYGIKQEKANSDWYSNCDDSDEACPPPEKMRRKSKNKSIRKSKSKSKSKTKVMETEQDSSGEHVGKIEFLDRKWNEVEMGLFRKEMQLKHCDGIRQFNYGSINDVGDIKTAHPYTFREPPTTTSSVKQQLHQLHMHSISPFSMSSSTMGSVSTLTGPPVTPRVTALTGESFPFMTSSTYQHPAIGTMEMVPGMKQTGAHMGISGYEQLAGRRNIYDSNQLQLPYTVTTQQQQQQQHQQEAPMQAMTQMSQLSPITMGHAVQNMQFGQASPRGLQGSTAWQAPQLVATDTNQNVGSPISFGSNGIGYHIPSALTPAQPPLPPPPPPAPPSHHFGTESMSNNTGSSNLDWRPEYATLPFETDTMNALPRTQFGDQFTTESASSNSSFLSFTTPATINGSCNNSSVGKNSDNGMGVLNDVMGMSFDDIGSNGISSERIRMNGLNGTNVNGNLTGGNGNIGGMSVVTGGWMPMSMSDYIDDCRSLAAFMSPSPPLQI